MRLVKVYYHQMHLAFINLNVPRRVRRFPITKTFVSSRSLVVDLFHLGKYAPLNNSASSGRLLQ